MAFSGTLDNSSTQLENLFLSCTLVRLVRPSVKTLCTQACADCFLQYRLYNSCRFTFSTFFVLLFFFLLVVFFLFLSVNLCLFCFWDIRPGRRPAAFEVREGFCYSPLAQRRRWSHLTVYRTVRKDATTAISLLASWVDDA